LVLGQKIVLTGYSKSYPKNFKMFVHNSPQINNVPKCAKNAFLKKSSYPESKEIKKN
jgi:hypothetical protein